MKITMSTRIVVAVAFSSLLIYASLHAFHVDSEGTAMAQDPVNQHSSSSSSYEEEVPPPIDRAIPQRQNRKVFDVKESLDPIQLEESFGITRVPVKQ
ncbi:hypothetical protein [Saccharospirillum salsuginis]|uniref:Uncharacterized protein n=1 Tax=Saccharospirillum salsuginis TaxID=418750 RepID=A0A918KSM9_9GAMM|nr:hypothetical protein [Saccharospirillum salsuginis]GGX72894.1 hypothetical protein GCM10007392_45310 [Saccharospirillum salsuginis]